MNPTTMKNLLAQCSQCLHWFDLEVNADRYARWLAGEGLIQNMLPELTERELLISSICNACFDRLFEDGSDA